MPAKLSKVMIMTGDDALFRAFSLLLRDSEFYLLRPPGSGPVTKFIRNSDPALVLLDIDRAPGTMLIDLCRILVEAPRPVLLVTRDPESSRAAAAKGLNLGAVDVLTAPENPASLTPQQKQRMLRVLSTSASLRVSQLAFKDMASAIESVSRSDDNEDRISELFHNHLEAARNFDVGGVAISTGGPNALSQFIPTLPASFPVPVLVVQHILPGFITGIVARLNESCEVRVKMAEQDEPLAPGTVYFAPDRTHLMVCMREGAICARLGVEPSHLMFCPSADVLFASMAETCGSRCLGVIMTGMGHDGVEGLRSIKNIGGVTVAQDRQSSAIFGMARVAVDANIIDCVVPLQRMAAEIFRLLYEEKAAYSVKSSSSS